MSTAGTETQTLDIHTSPLLDAVAALWADRVRGDEGGHAAGPMTANARAARREILARLGDDDELRQLVARWQGTGLAPLFAATLAVHETVPSGDGRPELVAELAKRVAGTAGRPAVRLKDVDAPAHERLSTIHEQSNYGAQRLLATHVAVRLWPSACIDPAPAGKVGQLVGDEESVLHLAFGDVGHVGSAGGLSWPQWYRLGVWHALLRRAWTPAVMRAFASDERKLNELLAAIPPERRTVAGAHDFSLKRHDTWASYFLDRLVSAGKVVLEHEVAGTASAAEQRRWFRSLGRSDLDWFVETVGTAPSLDDLDIGAVARAWGERGPHDTREPAFEGPLAACENPLWNRDVAIAFSPGVDRVARRSIELWFRSYWSTPPAPTQDVPWEPGWSDRSRIVFALGTDSEWAEALAGGIALGAADRRPSRLSDAVASGQPFGIVVAYRHRDRPACWTRLCIASDVNVLLEAHRTVRHYSDWTAIGGHGRSYGDVAIEDDTLRLLTREPEAED